jgi:hypothetical protein
MLSLLKRLRSHQSLVMHLPRPRYLLQSMLLLLSLPPLRPTSRRRRRFELTPFRRYSLAFSSGFFYSV